MLFSVFVQTLQSLFILKYILSLNTAVHCWIFAIDYQIIFTKTNNWKYGSQTKSKSKISEIEVVIKNTPDSKSIEDDESTYFNIDEFMLRFPVIHRLLDYLEKWTYKNPKSLWSETPLHDAAWKALGSMQSYSPKCNWEESRQFQRFFSISLCCLG